MCHKTQPNHTYWIYVSKVNLALITYNGWYAIKPNQIKSYIFNISVLRGFGIK